MNSANAELQKGLTASGARLRALPISRLPQLRSDIQDLRDSGVLSDDFLAHYRSLREFQTPDWAAKGSIIIIAEPQARSVITVSVGGRKLDLDIPPTYVSAAIKGRRKGELEAATGGKAERALLPEKTLAARTGLARYGRNNVCYAEGMGSFMWLEAYWLEADLGADHWQERETMPQCDKCRLCLEACPTGAIRADRFTIEAARCITLYNEDPGDLPGWIKPQWHNAAIGCMRCQEACPANRPYLGKVERSIELDPKETELFMGRPLDKLPESLAAKLARLEMDEGYDILARNLRALARY